MGYVIAYYLAKTSSPNDNPLIIELLDEHVFQLNEWEIPMEFEEDLDMVVYFNGSRCEQSEGAGVVFIRFPYHTPLSSIFLT